MTPVFDSRVQAGCATLISQCGNHQFGESVYIVCDEHTEQPARCLESYALEAGIETSLSVVQPLAFHGSEPPTEVEAKMKAADLVFGMTSMSMAHTAARLKASQTGTRYLSLPDYSFDVLRSTALTADFRAITLQADLIAERLTKCRTVHLKNAMGTDIRCSVAARSANSAPGWVRFPGDLASPPDAEVNIAPIEGSADGLIVVDGSIPAPGLGLLEHPVKLEVRDGMIRKVSGPQADVLEELLRTVDDPKASLLAEIGWGLNDKAVLCGSMLEDEGCVGTVHFGFGANKVLGGESDVSFHLDCIVRDVMTVLDDRELISI